ncbi:MAG: RNA polymerase sigma factor [Planctomycetes bacterium]|nr:RNA polymerase sigma factor [Planctomycetota bacterium]NBY02994.1 RNA polymerase sigma factor [Planctomycetota bacterium]
MAQKVVKPETKLAIFESGPLEPNFERLVKGDREEFAKLVMFYNEPLFRWVARLTGNSHAAEDLVQDTFVRAYQAITRLRPDTNLKAWLFRIAHNGYANWVRNRKGRNSILPNEIFDTHAGPEELAQENETSRRLQQAIDKLPEEWKAAMILRMQEEMAFREIAVALGTTEETARWRVYKARQKLMETLEVKQEDAR